MRLFRYLVPGLLFLAGCASGVQDVPEQESPGSVEEIRRHPEKAGCLMYVYDYSAESPMTPAPRGYRPFYISHFGRHGARYVLGMQYDTLYQVLDRAARAGRLTDRGERLFEEYKAFHTRVIPHEGELTRMGTEEQRVIAARLFRRFPEVFRGETRVGAIATTVPRVIMSMYAFTDALHEKDRSLHVEAGASDAFDPQLRFWLSPRAVNHPLSLEDISAPYLPYFRQTVDVSGILGRIFTEPATIGKSLSFDEVRFLRFLFVVDSGMQCLDTPEPLFDGLFTEEDRIAVARADWYRIFRCFCHYEDSGTIFPELAGQALQDIIDRAEEDMASGRMQLRLRFSHDSSMIPLVVRMNINGYGRMARTPEEAFEIYPPWEMPMGGSLQLIFYRRRPSDEILLKVLLNEREASLPFEAVTGPYYRWSDFKAYYAAP